MCIPWLHEKKTDSQEERKRKETQKRVVWGFKIRAERERLGAGALRRGLDGDGDDDGLSGAPPFPSS